MKIIKTSVIFFDEEHEKNRILSVFKSKRDREVKTWLLAILDQFVAGEFDKVDVLLRDKPQGRDENPYEYVNSVIFDIMRDRRMQGLTSYGVENTCTIESSFPN